MIKILIVDDQPLIRRGLRSLLRPEPDLEIVGEAEHGAAAIACLQTLEPEQQPQVILLDIRMPVMDGVAATAAIVAEFPNSKVLILTTFDDRQYLTQALQNGASGYLLKDTPAEELVQAIHLVAKGYTQLAPGLAQKLLSPPEPFPPPSQQPANQPTAPHPGAHPPSPPETPLTPREYEILSLIAQGSSNREIAQALYISEKTVKNHITNLLSRLGLRDRTQAAIYYHALHESP